MYTGRSINQLINLPAQFVFMRPKISVLLALLLICNISSLDAQKRGTAGPATYVHSRAPLRQNPFIELPLGAIQPEDWLKEMLISQARGATGHLDSLYPQVMNQRNGWRGGNGDQWERGPYWLDGLLPLAYILHDSGLIAKTRPWVEWTLNSQQADGYFGPSTDYPGEPGLQRDNSRDWWPKMVMLKVLQQYYSATGDQRVIRLLTNYFRYQLQQLPAQPLEHWTFWARYRAGDNLLVVYWLYNITGDKFLLDLAELLHKQTFDYTHTFLNTSLLSTPGAIHGVNLAQGFKEPLIYYQGHPDKKYLEATKKGFADLDRYDGLPFGLFGADESIHGSDPTQGSELCTAVEMMYSLENLLQVTGDVDFADRLEKIAFNALPAQIDADFIHHQYFQQANQVMATRAYRNFDVNHDGTDLCYGLLTGFPCCTSNMHQGWPKFTQNLWYATPDNGLAALVYAPSTVRARVAGGGQVEINESTDYPFDGGIKFIVKTINGEGAAVVRHTLFPFRLRIPKWCGQGVVLVNGKRWDSAAGGQVLTIKRDWSAGDIVELTLPMRVFTNTWHENAVSVERGPLIFALRIEQTVTLVKNEKDSSLYGNFFEVRPSTPWNYGLLNVRAGQLEQEYTIEKAALMSLWPWQDLQHAPLVIKTKARRLPAWKLYNEMAGPLPYSTIYNPELGEEEVIRLVPYGCTKLRISEFPVIGR